MRRIELLLLGSGTSQGVPAIGCACETCASEDPRDRRLRPSAVFIVDGKYLLVDVSSDFRQQMLQYQIPRIDAVLMTHHHFDHIGGFDDLRQYNFIQRSPVEIYGQPETLNEMRTTFRYAFQAEAPIGGGVPEVLLHTIDVESPLQIADITVRAFTVYHGNMPVLGYRIGNIAYVTDTNAIPREAMACLTDLDVLVLDALRHSWHPTHFRLCDAVEVAGEIGAKRTFFTHIAHDIHHERDSASLPEEMFLGYDGLRLMSEAHPND